VITARHPGLLRAMGRVCATEADLGRRKRMSLALGLFNR
jgi:hypothetical protein